MKFFSFDLSFTGTGVCLLDDDHKTINFWQIKSVLEKQKTFENIQKAISSIIADIGYIISSYEKLGECRVLMEQPFCGAGWSAGLYGLDSVFYQRFRSILVRTYHPSTLIKIFGRNRTKHDSIALAQDILSDLEKSGWRTDAVPFKGVEVKTYKLTDDQSEALIYNVLYHIERKHEDFVGFYPALHCERMEDRT